MKSRSSAHKRFLCYWNQNAAMTDVYRSIRANIEFSRTRRPQVILVTSPGLSEGKSVTAANVAVLMAQAGQNTLYIDLNVRHPDGHSLFYLTNDVGVTSFLKENLTLDKVVQATSMQNLSVITSGPVSEADLDNLESPRLSQLIHETRQAFDVILIDSPPLLGLADAQIIAHYVDGCVLVIQSGKTSMEAVSKARQQLEKTGTAILGAVLNSKKFAD